MERSGVPVDGHPEAGDPPRLARVTYLPGVQPPDRSAPPSSGSRHPAGTQLAGSELAGSELAGTQRAAARPSFAAMYNLDDEDDAPIEATHDTSADEPERDREGELARAEKVSMHALTRRGQSRRELERTLRSRDLPDDVISHEVERLERVGLIDDVALAQNLVGVLQEGKGLGRTGIASELTRRLLSPAAIEYALDLVDTGDELARAREIAVKRASQLTSYDRATAERRLSAFLARRGYSGSTIRAAVENALSGRATSNGVRFR